MVNSKQATRIARALRELNEKIGGSSGRHGKLAGLSSDPDGAAKKHEDIMYETVILRRAGALLEGKGTYEEKSVLVTTFLLEEGLLQAPKQSLPEWRASRFLYLIDQGYDELQAIWGLAKQEGPGTAPEAILRSLRDFKKAGWHLLGASGQDFSRLPGLTGEKLRSPPTMPDFHQQEKCPPHISFISDGLRAT